MASASAAVAAAGGGSNGAGSLDDVVRLAESAAQLEAQRALAESMSSSSAKFVTQDQLQSIMDQMAIVSDTHASMQLAVSQLKAVSPELGRLLSIIKVQEQKRED